jgi:DNA polymerase III psi subunit
MATAKKATPKRAPVKNPRGSSGRPPIRQSLNADELALRRQKSLELRLKGYQLREIAAIVGVSAQLVQHDIKLLINANMSEQDIVTARALEEERLDKVLRIAVAISEGRANPELRLKANEDQELRLKAIDRIQRIVNQRATLLGLNAPVRHDVMVTERTQQDIELEQMINEAKAKNALVQQQLAAEVGTDDPAGA